jgi:hypothetical protein
MTGCVDAQVIGRAGGQHHLPEGAVAAAEVDYPPAGGISQLGEDGGLLHHVVGIKGARIAPARVPLEDPGVVVDGTTTLHSWAVSHLISGFVTPIYRRPPAR